MLERKRYELKITFTESVLGTQPGKNTPASEYLRDKQKKAAAKAGVEEDLDEELLTLPEMVEKGTTVFHRDEDGNPMLYNYHVKGMLKESAQWLNGLHDVKNMRSKVNAAIMVEPRRIPLDGEFDEPLERPLRAQTMQGPRTSLVRSEQLKAGATFTCILNVLQLPKVKIKKELLLDLLQYGSQMGMMQWRNSGVHGQFDYELTELED